MTTRLVPSQGILSLFDPVFNLGTTIVDRNYFMRLKIRACHNESDTRKEFTHVPFDFTDDPSGIIPSLRLVLELDHPDLYAALWRATGGPLQVRQDDLLQAVVGRKTDEISDSLLFAKLVEVWTGKGRIPSQPKVLEPRPVALNKRGDKIQDPIG